MSGVWAWAIAMIVLAIPVHAVTVYVVTGGATGRRQRRIGRALRGGPRARLVQWADQHPVALFMLLAAVLLVAAVAFAAHVEPACGGVR